MPKVRILQTNFTSGVIDKKLAAREDTVYYYNGLNAADNLLVIPQGGVIQRPALQYVRELSPVFTAIDLSGATVTVPNGGTASNLKDGNSSTVCTTSSNLSTTNPFVVAHVDFGEDKVVTAVDIINYKLSSGSLDDEFRVQYSDDDSAFTDFGTPFNWSSDNRSRRIRRDAGAVSARYWRIVRIGSTGIAATATIAEIAFMAESGTLSASRLLPFAYSTTASYMMAVTDGNIDILSGADFHGSIAIPHSSAELEVLNWTQSLDTMLLYHVSHAPFKIFRQGDNDEFDFRDMVFRNIPQYDYGTGTGGANEVQVLSDGGTLAASDKFTILLDGERTTTITANATRSVTATNIQTALRALDNTSATGITVTNDTDGFTVTFSGDDGKQPWGEMDISVIAGNSVWSVSRTTKGEYPGENIFSDTRGYPRCGVFHQSRHIMGGIPSVPDALLLSVLGDIENFDINQDDATRAILKRADTDQVGAIYQIVVGRHLSLFTNDAEFYIPSEVIDVDIVLKKSTGAGSKEAMRVHEVDGALLFIQGNKKSGQTRETATSVREFIFVDTEQAYRSNLVSKLSSHLIKNPTDDALRKALSTDESDILLLVNEDGTATAYTVLRTDAVNAFMPLSLRAGDKYMNVGVDKNQRVYFVTQRVINGVTRRYIEMWNQDLYLDCGGIVDITAEEFTATAGQTDFTWTFDNPAEAAAIGIRIDGGRLTDGFTVNLGTKTASLDTALAGGETVRVAKMVNSVTGLDHLTGETVQTFVDGTPGEDVTVTDGTITLPSHADTQIQYGFNFNVSGKLMPFRIPETETLADKKLRCSEVTMFLDETIGIDIKANDGEWYPVPLADYDTEVLDKSAIDLLYSGEKTLGGMSGYAVGAPVEFRRSTAGPFTLLGITREVLF